MILDQINQPNDIKKIAPKDYDMLAAEIRDFLLQKISATWLPIWERWSLRWHCIWPLICRRIS